MERVNPLDNFFFLKTFGEKGDEESLLGLLNAILKRTGRDGLVSVDISGDKTLTAEVAGKKMSILDVVACTDKGDYVNIEVQLQDPYNMDRRSLFYWSKQYVKNLDAGQDYKDLPNVIAINIVDFDYIKTGDFHASFHLWEDRDRTCMLTKAIEIHFINMVKFRKLKTKDIKNNSLERWLMYLDKGTPPEIIEEIIKMDTTIERTNDRLMFLSQDARTMRLYELQQKGQLDWNSVVNARDQNARERDQNARERDEAIQRSMEAERELAETKRRLAEYEAKK
jgi:predicted transposase/invertase (TIGR01784 family)